jgi:hypothetical protein
MKQPITTTYLEMADRTQFRPAESGGTALQLVRVEIPRSGSAGGGRAPCRGTTNLDRPDLETWVAYLTPEERDAARGR